jgi:hypothetical protein
MPMPSVAEQAAVMARTREQKDDDAKRQLIALLRELAELLKRYE